MLLNEADLIAVERELCRPHAQRGRFGRVAERHGTLAVPVAPCGSRTVRVAT